MCLRGTALVGCRTCPRLACEIDREKQMSAQLARPRSCSAGAARDLQLQGRPAVRDHDGGVGHRRHAGGRVHRRAADVPRPDLRHSLAVLRAPAPAAHQRRGLRVRRLRAVRHQLLRGPAHLSRAAVLRQAGGLHLLGLAGGHRAARRSRCRWASPPRRSTPSWNGRSTS